MAGFINKFIGKIDHNLYRQTKKPFVFWAVGDTFLAPLLRWLGQTQSKKMYISQVEQGRSLKLKKRPQFGSNVLFETYYYPNSPKNETFIKVYVDGREVRPFKFSKTKGEIKLIDFRYEVLQNKDQEKWDYMRHQRVIDYIEGVEHPLVKYSLPIMIVML